MADRKVTSRLNMANSVKEVCDDNTSVVALVPAFVLLVAGLGTKITALRDLIKKLSKKNSGLNENKVNWKEELALLLSVVCGAGVAYAKKINDVVLENNFDFARTPLADLRDTELIETAQSIIDLQTTVAGELKDYGIDSAFMEKVTIALDSFEVANPKPITNVSTTKANHELLLKMAFSLSDYVLENMMRAALIYKVLDPIFYASLDNASLIRNQGLRHDETPEEAAARKAANKLKRAAKAAEKAAKEAEKLAELAKKKEVQEPQSTEQLLGKNVQEMNADSVNTETPETPAPSQNGI